MPLGELEGDAAENGRSNQIQMATGPATHESIEETIIKPREKGRGEAAAGEKRMGCGFSYETRGLLSAKGRTGQQGRKWGKAIERLGVGPRDFVLSRSMRISVPIPYARISTASLSICSSVKPDLRLMIFSSCASESANRALERLRSLAPDCA